MHGRMHRFQSKMHMDMRGSSNLEKKFASNGHRHHYTNKLIFQSLLDIFGLNTENWRQAHTVVDEMNEKRSRVQCNLPDAIDKFKDHILCPEFSLQFVRWIEIKMCVALVIGSAALFVTERMKSCTMAWS